MPARKMAAACGSQRGMRSEPGLHGRLGSVNGSRSDCRDRTASPFWEGAGQERKESEMSSGPKRSQDDRDNCEQRSRQGE